MRKLIVSVLAIVIGVPGVFAAEAVEALRASGVKGGIIVRIGLDNPEELAALRAGQAYVVQGLDTDAVKVDRAQDFLLGKNLTGPISVAQFDGKKLPYINNLVNLVIVDRPGVVSNEEILRVLAPYGTAMVGGKRVEKPYPKQMDEWPQYLHGADNNAVAKDTVVGPPRHMQWVNDPAWSRSHMTIPTVTSMVTARGRLFTIEDQSTPENPFLPGRFALVTRDAFNGTVLWELPFATWESITRYVKDIAVQLQKRLVADGDYIYCTPGIAAPLTRLDAATGKALRIYAGTAETQEFALHNGVLYAIVGDRMNAGGEHYDKVKTYSGKGISEGGTDAGENAKFDGTGFAEGYAKEFIEKETTISSIVAIDAESGKMLWTEANIANYTGGSLALKDDFAVYLCAKEIKALNAKTGKKVWSVDLPPIKGPKVKKAKDGKPQDGAVGPNGTRPNVLVISGQIVYATHNGEFTAYTLKTGDARWSNPIKNNYEKTADLFVVRGTAWTGGAGAPTSYDPEVGRPDKTLQQLMNGPMGHDRCYRNFITEKYYINSKTGGADFVDLKSGEEFPNHWLRGTCGMGTLPANGLLYAPPFSCQCSMGSMIKNFNALYTEPGLLKPDQPIRIERKIQLVKGPAYSGVRSQESVSSSDWPVFRADNSRSAATATTLPVSLKEKWQVKFTGIPSAPVMAGGKVFVADVDVHTVYALNAADGKVLWRFAAGGRIDSPPTYHQGLLLFGSHDGWAYCLRAADGALVWKFKDLPDRLIGAFNQLESAWPVHGSILVENDTAYFSAGRSSFLDGGIVVYALDPKTGTVKHDRAIYGPFDDENGFPAVTRNADNAENNGFKGDIMLTGGEVLYMRHKAFNADLSAAENPASHLIPSAGFLDKTPQHRTFWTFGTDYAMTKVNGIDADIITVDDGRVYGVGGFPTHRHSYFDPRKAGYRLFCSPTGGAFAASAGSGKGQKKREKGQEKNDGASEDIWSTSIPLTGKAMLKAGDTLCIAGTPMQFDGNPFEKYVDAYEDRLGGVLWMASAIDGSKISALKLEAAPAWGSMAAANGKLFISLKDETLRCFGD